MATASMPEKLREEVASAGVERPEARKSAVSALITELSHKTLLNVGSGEAWADLRASCTGLAAAVGQFVEAKIAPLAGRDPDAYRENP